METKPLDPEDWALPTPGDIADPADYDEPTEAELAELIASGEEDARLGRTIPARIFFERLHRARRIAS